MRTATEEGHRDGICIQLDSTNYRDGTENFEDETVYWNCVPKTVLQRSALYVDHVGYYSRLTAGDYQRAFLHDKHRVLKLRLVESEHGRVELSWGVKVSVTHATDFKSNLKIHTQV